MQQSSCHAIGAAQLIKIVQHVIELIDCKIFVVLLFSPVFLLDPVTP
jgi:hypothetical protein